MTDRVLITGASGLLGRALVDVFLAEGFFVLGQYHKHKPGECANCTWLAADFSTSAGISRFLLENETLFKDCPYLVNNYGPITYKKTGKLSGQDFTLDFFHNVVTAVDITRFFLDRGGLKSVVNLGFEFAGKIKAYKQILAYAAAKNALLLVTRSYEQEFPGTRFAMVNPGTLVGAKIKSPGGISQEPVQLAHVILDTLLGRIREG